MSAEFENVKILLVDNQNECRNMREQLRDLGFNQVSEMSNGLQVLTEVKKNRPMIMIANLNLPKYSGLQLFKSFRADKNLAGVKFIMTTPRLNRREVVDLELEGVANILQRPFTSEELKETVFRLLGFSSSDMRITAEQTAREAGELFQRGAFEPALKKYTEALDAYKDADFFYMQGRCYLEMGMIDHAIAAFHNATEKDRKHPEVDYWLGVAFQRKQEYKESVQALKRAARKKNATTDAHVQLGRSHLGANEIPEADAAFNAAISKNPGDIAVRTEVGNAYLDKELYEKAEGAFGEAIRVSPENIHLYNRMAIALRKQGKFKEAIDLYVKALNVAPNDEGLYFNLARALRESGDRAKAIKALGKALKIDPEFREAIDLRKEYLGSAG